VVSAIKSVVTGTTSVGHTFNFLEGRLAFSERKLEAITGWTPRYKQIELFFI